PSGAMRQRTNAKSAVRTLPSPKLTTSRRQVPPHVLSVFQTYVYVSVVASYERPLLPGVSVSSTSPVPAESGQAIRTEFGEPGAKMSSPLKPPSVNCTGTPAPG